MKAIYKREVSSYFNSMIGWIFVRADTLPQAAHYITRLFVALPVPALDLAVANRTWTALAIAAVTSFMPESWWDRLGWTSAHPATRAQATGRILVGTVLFLLACASLANQSYNPFIYFRF